LDACKKVQESAQECEKKEDTSRKRWTGGMLEGRNFAVEGELVNHNRPSPHLFSELRILKKLGAEIMELRILKDLGLGLSEVAIDSKGVSGKLKDKFAELRILRANGGRRCGGLKSLGADAKPKTESGKCWGTGGRAAASFRKEKSGRGYVASTMQDGSMPVSSC
jgi:hypothetical protein